MTAPFTPTALRISSGIIVWGLHFTAIYGLTAVACARNAASAVPWIVIVSTLIGAALAAAIVAFNWPRRQHFEHWLAATLAAFGLLGIVFEGLTILMITPCR